MAGLTVATGDRVATVTIDRQDRRNALDQATRVEGVAAFAEHREPVWQGR